MTEQSATGNTKNDDNCTGGSESVYERLNYERLTMEMFQYVREIHGSDECEFCGRLFYQTSEYETHLNMHTGTSEYKTHLNMQTGAVP